LHGQHLKASMGKDDAQPNQHCLRRDISILVSWCQSQIKIQKLKMKIIVQ